MAFMVEISVSRSVDITGVCVMVRVGGMWRRGRWGAWEAGEVVEASWLVGEASSVCPFLQIEGESDETGVRSGE